MECFLLKIYIFPLNFKFYFHLAPRFQIKGSKDQKDILFQKMKKEYTYIPYKLFK